MTVTIRSLLLGAESTADACTAEMANNPRYTTRKGKFLRIDKSSPHCSSKFAYLSVFFLSLVFHLWLHQRFCPVFPYPFVSRLRRIPLPCRYGSLLLRKSCGIRFCPSSGLRIWGRS